MDSFLLALQMLTRIYIRPLNYTEKASKGSVLYFSIIGLILGAIISFVAWAAHLVFPMTAVAGIVVIGMVILSGGLHMDGFMDTLDGVLSGRPRERKLEIMKDSRVGAFGALGAVGILLFKYSLVVSVPLEDLFTLLVLMPVLSRWCMAFAVVAYPYARKEGFGMNHAKAGKKEFLPATLITVILAFVISGLAGLITMLTVFLLGWFLCNRLAKQLGGLTGDTYGAVNESMEVAVLLVYFILSANLPKVISCTWGGFDWSSYCGWAAFWLW